MRGGQKAGRTNTSSTSQRLKRHRGIQGKPTTSPSSLHTPSPGTTSSYPGGAVVSGVTYPRLSSLPLPCSVLPPPTGDHRPPDPSPAVLPAPAHLACHTLSDDKGGGGPKNTLTTSEGLGAPGKPGGRTPPRHPPSTPPGRRRWGGDGERGRGRGRSLTRLSRCRRGYLLPLGGRLRVKQRRAGGTPLPLTPEFSLPATCSKNLPSPAGGCSGFPEATRLQNAALEDLLHPFPIPVSQDWFFLTSGPLSPRSGWARSGGAGLRTGLHRLLFRCEMELTALSRKPCGAADSG